MRYGLILFGLFLILFVVRIRCVVKARPQTPPRPNPESSYE